MGSVAGKCLTAAHPVATITIRGDVSLSERAPCFDNDSRHFTYPLGFRDLVRVPSFDACIRRSADPACSPRGLDLCRSVRIFFDRRLESDLPQPDDTGQHGIGEALTVLGFILTQAIAVVISQVGRPALYKASWWDLGGLAVLYGAVTLAILGAAVRMLQSTRVVCDRRRRTYDGGTIRFMKYVVCCGVAMAVLIPPLALLGILPAQGPTGPVQLDWTGISGKIPAVDEDLKELQDPDLVGKPAIRIEIQISPSDFRGEIPKSLTTKVAIAPAVLDKGWRVFDAEIFVGEPAKKIKHFPAPLVPAQIRDLNSTPRPLVRTRAQPTKQSGIVHARALAL